MKRSNNVENCLTLSLYFWMLPMAWDCWGPGFPGRFPSNERGETSKIQRNWGRRRAGGMSTGQSGLSFSRNGITDVEGSSPRLMDNFVFHPEQCFTMNMSKDGKLITLKGNLFYAQESLLLPALESAEPGSHECTPVFTNNRLCLILTWSSNTWEHLTACPGQTDYPQNGSLLFP